MIMCVLLLLALLATLNKSKTEIAICSSIKVAATEACMCQQTAAMLYSYNTEGAKAN